MPTIGSLSMLFVKGILVEAVADFIPHTRAGIVGTGLTLGVRHDPVQQLLTEQLFDTEANAGIALAAYRAMESTQQTLVDQFGTTWANTTVCRVVPRIFEVIHPTTPWLLMSEWDVVLETA